jgi:hypothetical protein
MPAKSKSSPARKAAAPAKKTIIKAPAKKAKAISIVKPVAKAATKAVSAVRSSPIKASNLIKTGGKSAALSAVSNSKSVPRLAAPLTNAKKAPAASAQKAPKMIKAAARKGSPLSI